ncbi:carbohydrate porin [Nitrincola alkalilacustris]|uniref:carbohydrate porin n=1 Tax=Nitrincola alkalilacustris TaxID=1571224 RepID=UPI00124D6352|nr:carbohydrate porin [Nitrincola alkalilacustris]
MNRKPFAKHRLSGQIGLVVLSAVLAAPVLAADTSFGIDANIELDTDAVKSSSSSTKYSQGGRVEVNVHGEHRMGEHFVKARGTGLLKKGGDTGTDDMWIMFGSNAWDLQAGRFEALNLFPLGKDTLIAHAGGGQASVYEANLVRGRVSDGGQFAFHLNPSDNLSFELATAYGQGDKTRAFTGIRPSVTFRADAFSLSAGYEHQKFDESGGAKVDKNGVGVTAGFNAGDAVINLSVAHLRDSSASDKIKVNSYGANVTYGPFGAGLIHSKTSLPGASDPDVTTAYAAYTVPLFDIDRASVTFAGSTSRASNVAADKTVNALRMRFNYAF